MSALVRTLTFLLVATLACSRGPPVVDDADELAVVRAVLDAQSAPIAVDATAWSFASAKLPGPADRFASVQKAWELPTAATAASETLARALAAHLAPADGTDAAALPQAWRDAFVAARADAVKKPEARLDATKLGPRALPPGAKAAAMTFSRVGFDGGRRHAWVSLDDAFGGAELLFERGGAGWVRVAATLAHYR